MPDLARAMPPYAASDPACGASWGGRADVIQRAAFALVELIETVVRGCDVLGLIRIEASFDDSASICT